MKNGNRYYRVVYVILDRGTQEAYVGLTCNPKKRLNAHRQGGSAKELVSRNCTMLILTRVIPVEEAKKFEAFFISLFSKGGFHVLNRAKPGGIGGTIREWKQDRCREEALKYQYRTHFARYSPKAYQAAHSHGFLDDICNHMPVKKPKAIQIWTFEKCQNEALRYRTRKAFCDGSKGAYLRSYKSGWLDTVCAHMPKPQPTKWTYAACKAEAAKHRYRIDFSNASHRAYMVAWESGWLQEICEHMPNRTAKRNNRENSC